jgi:nuclear GTP-binding protein
LPQEVTIPAASGKSIRFIDTPGLTWSTMADLLEDGNNTFEGLRARDILLRSKGRIDRLKDPSSVGTLLNANSRIHD